MRVNANAFGGAAIECDEHPGMAFAGDRVVRSASHIMSTVSGMVLS
jgi:hypothetical protein